MIRRRGSANTTIREQGPQVRNGLVEIVRNCFILGSRCVSLVNIQFEKVDFEFKVFP